MCGIVAVFSQVDSKVNIAEAGNMLDSLKHRGPDSSSVFTTSEESVFLGFNRLAIIDTTENSMQPILDNSRRFSLIFNGEIYNYLEIKEQLIALGYHFKSTGDAEVIINAYHAWGEACFSKFNGMWAVVIYDSRDRKLTLCRDRFGVKPLYFSRINKRIYVASELKAFSRIQGVSFELDPLEINYGHLFPSALPNTVLSGVSKLLPGQLLRVSQESLQTTFIRWWDLPNEILEKITEPKAQNESLDSILESSISLRMRSDVPIAFSLSSGVDSTLIIAKAAKMGFSSITAFSQGSSDLEDESILAAQTAKALGVDFRISNLEERFSIDLLLESVFALEGSQSLGVGVLAHYKEISASGFKVVIEGHGGDELFGGYESQYRRVALHNLIRFRFNAWLKNRKMASMLNGIDLESTRSLLRKNLKNDLRDSLMQEIMRVRKFEELKNEIDLQLKSKGLDNSYNPMSRNELRRTLDFGNQVLLQDFSYNTLPKILENFDKLSMSQSLEVRSPFLDWRLVLASFSISGNDKFFGSNSKQYLRNLMPEEVPNLVRNNRRKLGFSGHNSWLLLRPVRELILDASHSHFFRESPFWNGKMLSAEISDAILQKDGRRLMLHWGKLQLSIFMDAFVQSKF